MTAEYAFSPLGPNHDRAGFSCEVEELNVYLRQRAGQDIRANIAVAWVMARPEAPERILGYYTLSSLSIELTALASDLSKKLPSYPRIPVTLLGRMARSETAARGSGEILLMDALSRSLQASRQVASFAVVVDPKNQRLADWYGRYDFRQLPNSSRFILPMKKVAKLDL